MKYLIFGTNGMAGHMISLYLKEQGHKVIGFAKSPSSICHTIIGDALCENDIYNALHSEDFDIIINCIGVLNKEVDADMAIGIYLNSVFPHVLAKMLENKNTKLIHISTDCVFEGVKGANKEEDIPDAVSAYGKSKSLGELRDNKNLTFRTSIVGPEIKDNGIGLFHWFMKQKGTINGYSNVIWTGVTTLHLAKAIEKASYANITGLYHLVNNNYISKYNLICLFNYYLKSEDMLRIIKDKSVISNKSLVNTRTDFDYIVPDYEKMIQELSEWIFLHDDIYSHYNFKAYNKELTCKSLN